MVDCVAAAFEGFVPQIGKPPAPMLADYGALIARGQVHLVEGDGAVSGVLVLEARPDHLFVDVLAVRPERQRTGLGRRLMRFAAAEARRRGLLEIRLYTHEVMAGALALYQADEPPANASSPCGGARSMLEALRGPAERRPA